MMNYRRLLLKIVPFIFIACWSLPVHAQYVQAEKVLTANKPVKLTLPQADTLIVVYRPGSNISDTVRIPVEEPAYSWTPREAGIVALLTPKGPEQTVSVRFVDPPVSGYIILFGAAFILFGGALFASVKLFGTN